MLPLKIHELISHWFILPFLFVFYMLITFVTNWEIKNKYMFVFPIYSLVQVLVFPILGVCRYVETAVKTKNLGFIKVFYKHEYHPLKYCLNILIILSIAIALFNIHLIEGQLLLSNIDLFGLVGISLQSSNPLTIIYNGFKLFVILTGVFLFLTTFFKTAFYIKSKSKKIKKRKESVFKKIKAFF